jgi:putative MATE family efflux protein
MQSTEREERLRTGPIPRLLLTFSLPAIVGMLTQAVYNVVDRVFVGRWGGTDAIAGVAVCLPYMLVQLAFAMLIGFGSGAVVSIRLGQQKRNEAQQVLSTALVLLLMVSTVLTVVALSLIDPILRHLCSASQTVLPYSRAYLQIIAAGTVFQMIGFGLNAVVRGEGNPKVAMMTLLISVLVNIVSAPFLIFDHFAIGWSKVGVEVVCRGLGWGMHGAALATVIGQAVSALWVLWYFFRGPSLLKFRLRGFRFDPHVIGAIAAIGSAQFFMQLAGAVMNSLMNRQAGYYGGDVAISVMSIIWAMAMIVGMPVFGLNQGSQPVIGYNYGARQFDRVKRALLTAVLVASCVTVLGFVAAMTIPAQFVRLFDPDNDRLVELGSHAIRVAMSMFSVMGFQVISAGYFQAVGKPKHALALGLSRQVLILIPAILVLPLWFGLDGVWASLPTADFLSALITGLWLFLELRHLDRRHIENQPVNSQLDAPLPID